MTRTANHYSLFSGTSGTPIIDLKTLRGQTYSSVASLTQIQDLQTNEAQHSLGACLWHACPSRATLKEATAKQQRRMLASERQ